jgi:hypothetical protein
MKTYYITLKNGNIISKWEAFLVNFIKSLNVQTVDNFYISYHTFIKNHAYILKNTKYFEDYNNWYAYSPSRYNEDVIAIKKTIALRRLNIFNNITLDDLITKNKVKVESLLPIINDILFYSHNVTKIKYLCLLNINIHYFIDSGIYNRNFFYFYIKAFCQYFKLHSLYKLNKLLKHVKTKKKLTVEDLFKKYFGEDINEAELETIWIFSLYIFLCIHQNKLKLEDVRNVTCRTLVIYFLTKYI